VEPADRAADGGLGRLSEPSGARDPASLLDIISTRRSTGRLLPPAPSPEHLRLVLEAAAAAPDHGLLRPWKFVVLEADAKERFGEVLERAYVERCTAAGTEPEDSVRAKERTKFGRAPMVVVIAAVRRDSDRIPWEEQKASAAAAAQNLLLAATALGYGSMWRTGDPAYDPSVKRALGLRDEDAVVAFVYLGMAPDMVPARRDGPDLDEFVEHWRPPAS
jgi:nitroreductase